MQHRCREFSIQSGEMRGFLDMRDVETLGLIDQLDRLAASEAEPLGPTFPAILGNGRSGPPGFGAGREVPRLDSENSSLPRTASVGLATGECDLLT